MAGITGRAAAGQGPTGCAGGQEAVLAGITYPQLREKLRDELFNQFIPLMNRYVIDHENGGFNCRLKEDGSPLDETKDTLFQGRGIWIYSYLYNHLDRNPAHLEVARKTVRLLMKSKPSEENRLWPAKLSRAGEPLAPPLQTIGVDVAIAEGLAEFSMATDDRQHWDLAREILLKCVGLYDRPGYAADVVSLYQGPKRVSFPGARTQGVAMILLGTVGPMLRMRADSKLGAIASSSTDAIMNRHFNPEFRLNNELLNHDYSRPADELAQFVYTAHCVETFSIVLQQAAHNKDWKLFQTAAERFRRHSGVAWDDVYGGLLRSLNNVGKDEWELNKVLWVQEEAMNACLTIIEHTDAEWARGLFGKIYEYVRSLYYLDRWGYSFWISGGDRKVTLRPDLTRVENYHHPRYLMSSILALERMMRRGGQAVRPSSEGGEGEAGTFD